MIDVSIVMYVKDSGKYLKESVDSIIHQSLKSVQIICLYENSTDDSLDILKRFSGKYPNISIREVESFSTKEILETLKKVEGDYVIFADSFNMMKRDILKKSCDKISVNPVDVLLFKLNDSDEEKALTRISQLVGTKPFTPKKIREYVWNLNQTLNNKMIKKSFLVSQLDLYDIFVQSNDNISLLSLINSEKLSLMDESLYETNNPCGHPMDDGSFRHYVDSQNIFLNLLNKKEYSDYRINGINKKFSDIVNMYNEVPVKYKKESFKTLRDYCINYLEQKERNVELFTEKNRKDFEQIIISESVEEYELLKNVSKEKKSINFMRRYEKIISVEHKKIKNFNENLRNSRSWKLTSIFRLRNKF